MEFSNAAIRCAHDAQVDPRMLKPNPSNPNFHSEKQIELFIEILKFQGWRRPITVSKRSGYITKGHGAREAALKAGFKIVPVDYQDYDSDEQELADIVADNQLQRMSEMDTGKLTELLVSIDTGILDLKLTGLETTKIEAMLSTVPGYSDQTVDNDLAVDYPDVQTDLESQEEKPTAQYAEKTQHVGGEAASEPHHENLPEPQTVSQSNVRMIQLYFTQETVAEFMSIVHHFQKKYEIENVTDTVLMVLRDVYSCEGEQ